MVCFYIFLFLIKQILYTKKDFQKKIMPSTLFSEVIKMLTIYPIMLNWLGFSIYWHSKFNDEVLTNWQINDYNKFCDVDGKCEYDHLFFNMVKNKFLVPQILYCIVIFIELLQKIITKFVSSKSPTS